VSVGGGVGAGIVAAAMETNSGLVAMSGMVVHPRMGIPVMGICGI
jgi:hypothetical protein